MRTAMSMNMKMHMDMSHRLCPRIHDLILQNEIIHPAPLCIVTIVPGIHVLPMETMFLPRAWMYSRVL